LDTEHKNAKNCFACTRKAKHKSLPQLLIGSSLPSQ